ncbi:hypothetical protein CR513_17219, partial [Mucuna pruriens]
LEAIKGARGREAPTQQETPQSFWGQPFSQEIDETRVPPNFREIMVEPFDGSQDPRAHLQAFQAQMYISGGDDRLSCKLFPGTRRGVAMQWIATLPPRTIQKFNDLADAFTSQFAANKKKQLEVADLFDIKQSREESLKSYLARSNTTTVRVNDPDQKFFIKAFQKGLRASPFSDSRQDTGSDEPMVISVTAKQYKIERVLVDQGSLANILYWVAVQKLGIRDLTRCEGVLYGFAGERVPIMGTVEIETTFGDKNGAKTIPVTYTIVNSEASYNIIMGRPALNRLEAVVSTYHLCMKFPVGQTVATVWADITAAKKCYEDSLRIELNAQEDKVNVLDVDLDPRYFSEEKGPHPVGDLKKVQIGTSADQKTHIGTTLDEKEEELLVSTLQKNADVFAWTAKDMPGLDLRFMCHELSIKPGSKLIAQKKRKQGEEKRTTIKEEVEKLLAAGFVREVQYPTWLANVVMVKKANGRWRMCTDYTDLNKACPKDPYPLPSIDRLVDGVSGQALLSFMDAYS